MNRRQAIQEATHIRKADVVAEKKILEQSAEQIPLKWKWEFQKFESISQAKTFMRSFAVRGVALKTQERLANVCKDRL